MRRLALTLALAASGCIPNFGDFEIVDAVDAGPTGTDGGRDGGIERRDGGDTDGGRDAGADGGVDGGASDTRIDRVCATTWDELHQPSGDCAGREVTTIASGLETTSLALGRTADGTILVAFDQLEFADFGRIATRRFHQDDAPNAAAGPTIEPESTIGEVVGVDLALASGRDTYHFAYWLRSDFGHEVRYRTLRGDSFGPPQTLATVSRIGVVDIVLDSAGRPAVLWHDDNSGIHRARRIQSGDQFGPQQTLQNDTRTELEGEGAVGLAAGPDGVLHAVSQWATSLSSSAPVHASWPIGGLTQPRTLDNQIPGTRTSGISVTAAAIGERVVVAYLDWFEGVGDVRLATIAGLGASPTIEVYRSGIPLPTRPGKHPLELEADSLGRLHLLLADYSAQGTSLQYHRQVAVGGTLRWIIDRIATIPAPPGAVAVAMTIGPDRRPHIAFSDPSRGTLQYATARP